MILDLRKYKKNNIKIFSIIIEFKNNFQNELGQCNDFGINTSPLLLILINST